MVIVPPKPTGFQSTKAKERNRQALATAAAQRSSTASPRAPSPSARRP